MFFDQKLIAQDVFPARIGFVQKHPDVHKIVLSIKLRSPPPPGKSVNLVDFLLICTVFPHFGPFLEGGGGKPNFADKNFMDTQPDFSDLCPGEICESLWLPAKICVGGLSR